jgi:hypothetical protein
MYGFNIAVRYNGEFFVFKFYTYINTDKSKQLSNKTTLKYTCITEQLLNGWNML